MSRQKIGRATLLFIMLCYIVFAAYLLLYSPSRQSVLKAEMYLTSDDVLAIEWIDKNIPKNAKILMDHYFQFYFTGITGRQRLYSITSYKKIWEKWEVYPVNVYIGRTDILKVDVDYMVISRWSYTAWYFVGKNYFDQHENLVQIYEHEQYVVYKVLR